MFLGTSLSLVMSQLASGGGAPSNRFALEKAVLGAVSTATQGAWHPDIIVQGYMGTTLQVKREGDGTTANIGADAYGSFDWDTANAFRQSGTGGTSTSKLWCVGAFDQKNSKFLSFTTGNHTLYDPAMGGRITTGTTIDLNTGQLTMDNTKGQQAVWIGGGQAYTLATATVTVVAGIITSVVPNNEGAGYTSNPTCTVAGSGGSGASITPNIVGDKITSYTINNGGTGYPTGATTVTVVGGILGAYGEATASGLNVSTAGIEIHTGYQMMNRKKAANATSPSEPAGLGATSTAETIMSYSAGSTDNFNYEVSGGNYMFRARRNKSALSYDQSSSYSGVIKKLGWQAVTLYTKKVGANTVSGLLGFGSKIWEHTATGVDVNTTTLDNKTLRIGSRVAGASGQATTTANMLWTGTVVTTTLTDAQRTWLIGCLTQNTEPEKAMTTASIQGLFDEYVPLNTVDNSNANYARVTGAKGNLALRFNKTTTNTVTKTFALDITVTSGVVSIALRNGYDGGLIFSGTPTVTITGANTTPASFTPVITASRITGFTGTGGTGYSTVTARASVTGVFTDTPEFNYSAVTPYTGLAGIGTTQDTNYANTFNAETNWGAEYKQSGTMVAICYRNATGYDAGYSSNLMPKIVQGCDVPPDANTVPGSRNKNTSAMLMHHHIAEAFMALCANDVSAQGPAIDPNNRSSFSEWGDVGGKVSQLSVKYKGKTGPSGWKSPQSMVSNDGTITISAKTFPTVNMDGTTYSALTPYAGGTFNFNGAGGATNLGSSGLTTALMASTDNQTAATPEERTYDDAGFNYMMNSDSTTIHIGTFFNSDEYTALVASAIASAGGSGASTSAKLTALSANLASREPYMARAQTASYIQPVVGGKIGHMDCSVAIKTSNGSVCHPHPDARFQSGQYLSNYAGVRVWFGFINRALTLAESQGLGVSLFKLVTPTP